MQLKYHMVTIEDLVPEEHLLRKVDAALDLSFVYEETAHLYNQISPVRLTYRGRVRQPGAALHFYKEAAGWKGQN